MPTSVRVWLCADTYVQENIISGSPTIQPALSHALAESWVTEHKAQVEAFFSLVCIHLANQCIVPTTETSREMFGEAAPSGTQVSWTVPTSQRVRDYGRSIKKGLQILCEATSRSIERSWRGKVNEDRKVIDPSEKSRERPSIVSHSSLAYLCDHYFGVPQPCRLFHRRQKLARIWAAVDRKSLCHSA